ncbi:MAG: polysaccharide biosynthesis/export family protein [Candidatus Omnitrophota bacterium]
MAICPRRIGPAKILHTPGERYSSEESRQHYLQGKDFYSQGRYTEARNEFEKAVGSTIPPRLVTEKVGPAQKALDIMPAELTTSKEKIVKEQKEEKAKEDKEKGEKAELIKGKPASSVAVFEVREGQSIAREYYIDVGDVLDISVWQMPDLSKSEVIVRPDGKISFPLIGDVKVEGFTLTQLDDVITEQLKTYVKVPEVSIMLRQFGESTNRVSILGEVAAPGVYRYSGPPSLAEVVASAGGYTKYSVIKSVMVIRYTGEGKKPEVIRINLAHILKGNKYSNNIWLKPNDVVYVPRSPIGNLTTFTELIQPAISEYMQTMDARRFHNIMHCNALK